MQIADYPKANYERNRLASKISGFAGCADMPRGYRRFARCRLVSQLCLKTIQSQQRQFGKPSRYSAELRCLSNAAWHLGYVRDWDASVLLFECSHEPSRTFRAADFQQNDPGSVASISRFFRLPKDGVSNCFESRHRRLARRFHKSALAKTLQIRRQRCVAGDREMARRHGRPTGSVSMATSNGMVRGRSPMGMPAIPPPPCQSDCIGDGKLSAEKGTPP